MCGEIAVRKIPKYVIDKYGLAETLGMRDGVEQPEVTFAYRHRQPRLPILLDGEMSVVEWGNRDNKLSRLPKTGWCRLDSFEAGKWKWLSPQRVTIPAYYGREKAYWFPILEGIEGLLVKDEQNLPHCYMLTADASPDFEAKSGHERMPVLIGQVI